MTSISYVALIKSARNAARDVLRTQKVSALHGYIKTCKSRIAEIAESIASKGLAIERNAYDLRIATEFEHPDLDDMQKNAAASDKSYAEAIARDNARVIEQEEKIKEYEEKINNWETGTSLVDSEEMNRLAKVYVQDKIGSDFNAGVYDTTAAEANKNAS